MSYLVVVGVDGSENSYHALRWAGEEAKLRGGTLTAVFAWQMPLIGNPAAFDPAEIEGQAKQALIEQVSEAEIPDGVEINQLVAQGDPSDSLQHTCERLGADLLVLGTHRRRGLAGVALDALADTPCPVVIVKPPAAKLEPADS